MSSANNKVDNNNLDKQVVHLQDSQQDGNLQEEKTLARRRFLKGLGLGGIAAAGGMSVSARSALIDYSSNSNRLYNKIYNEGWQNDQSNNNSWNNNRWNNDNWSEPQVTCYPATIATRLFSSSNASSSFERNGYALERMKCAGFHVENPEVMSRKYYRFGGSDSQRANDFEHIATGRVSAPKLLLGLRGGYGAMRILEKVNWHRLGRVMRERGTILGGFSDVTAIQCALLAKGKMGSFNLPMAYSEFGKATPDPISCGGFVRAVTDKNLTIHTYDSSRTSSGLPTVMGRAGRRVSGTLWGGNLSVLSSIAGSDYLPKPRGGIVFIEEVGEQPYRLERMMYDMYLAGAFKGQQAIVFGAMARSGSDGYDPSYDVSAVIRELHRITGLPIYSGVGFGHVSKKQSFPMGFHCDLVTTGNGFEMRFSGHPTIDNSLINEAALTMTV